MIGGRNYRDSPFNRATQARRQPGSTFKLVVYYAALRAGMTPDTMIDDSPITQGEYRPENSGDSYRGMIPLREAFARSSNVAAVRLYQQLGSEAINDAARDLGIAYVPEDRGLQGLVKSQTIAENIALANLKRVSSGWFVDAGKVLAEAKAAMARFGVKARGPEQVVRELSGGNQIGRAHV